MKGSALSGIACTPKSTSCVAIGIQYTPQGTQDYGIVVPVHHGSPGKIVKFPKTSFDSPQAVACSTATCWIVGEGSGAGFAARFDKGKLGAIKTIGGAQSLGSVSCGNAKICWATGTNSAATHAIVVRLSGGSAKVFTLKGTPPYLFRGGEGGNTDLLCVSKTSCAALGAAKIGKGPGEVMSIRNGKISSTKSVKGVGTFNSLACNPASRCIGVGVSNGSPATGLTVAIRRGHPKSPSRVKGADWLADVACPTGKECLAVGFAATNSGSNATVSTIAGKVKTTASFAGQLSGIACTSKSACWAVGTAQTSQTNRHAVVEKVHV